MDLVALEEVKQLKYRYLRTLDLKQWEAFEALFVPEATGEYGDLTFADRAEIVDYMRTNLGDGVVTMHQVHHPEIDVDGDTARGVWYLEDRVLVPEHRFVLEGAAFYDDRYVRTQDGWRILHTGYRRTFEASYSMDDLAGYRFVRGSAYDAPAR